MIGSLAANQHLSLLDQTTSDMMRHKYCTSKTGPYSHKSRHASTSQCCNLLVGFIGEYAAQCISTCHMLILSKGVTQVMRSGHVPPSLGRQGGCPC